LVVGRDDSLGPRALILDFDLRAGHYRTGGIGDGARNGLSKSTQRKKEDGRKLHRPTD
jgi:hypothetical protein